MVERISIAPQAGGGWAVKHGDGYLGHTRSEEDAMSIGRDLVDWLSSQGRAAELSVEARSFISERPRKA
jgi:hypothetical protein